MERNDNIKKRMGMSHLTDEEALVEVYKQRFDVFNEIMKENVDENGEILVSETWARKNILGQTESEIKEEMSKNK